MIVKIKKWLYKIKSNQEKIINISKENEWAHIYHDSIRGISWLENLPLNVGRWAGNYSFFYLLNRVLKDYKPKSVLEFGLGESTKFVTSYIENYLTNTRHVVLEHDEKWKSRFLENNKISSNTTINTIPLVKQEVNGYEVNMYEKINEFVKDKFDLYIIDGPFGSSKFSRYDIVLLAKKFNVNDEFIIILDDYHREGEKDTMKALLSIFNNKNIEVSLGVYSGNKSVAILATQMYNYATTL